jgi:TetR/AcrR family transcriptional regulator, transcriptional repressor for nem operon
LGTIILIYHEDAVARSREFDEDEALWKAVLVFWQRGYTNTSVHDLVEGTGLQRSSLYRTFGDKESLYRRAVERYTEEQLRRMPRGVGPKAAIRAWMEKSLEDAQRQDRPSGCLVISSAVEMPTLPESVRPLVSEHLARLRRFFLDAVRSARQRGEVRTDLDVERTAEQIFNAQLSLSVQGRTGADAATLTKVVEGALALLD